MAIQLPVKLGKFIRPIEFTNSPRQYVVYAAPEYKVAEKFGNPQDGGKAYFYYLRDENGERILQSGASRLVTAFNSAGVDVGDTIEIVRTGVGMDTHYSVRVVSKGANAPVQSSDIPF